MTTYRLKVGDRAPSPRTGLVTSAGAAVDLTGATVRFKARADGAAALAIDAAAVVENATAGTVRWDPGPTDTATAGTFLAEWEVTFAGGVKQSFPEGFDTLVIEDDLDSADPAATGSYATVAQARAAGAAGTDAQIVTALAAATERVDRYTGSRFLPVTETRVLRALDNGWCPSGARLASVTRVAPVGVATALPTTAYRVLSSEVAGQIDGVQLLTGYGFGHDVLIAGAEPWTGGWGNLVGGLPLRQIEVTATYGRSTPPDAVVEATALVAALIAPAPHFPAADAEGVPRGLPGKEPARGTPAPEDVAPAGRMERTTGSADADRLLEPYRVRGGMRVG